MKLSSGPTTSGEGTGCYVLDSIGAEGGAPPLWDTTFTLDGLLTQRAKGIRHVELDGVELNLVQLVDLINESFARQVQ